MKRTNNVKVSTNKVGATILATLLCVASYAQQITVAYMPDISTNSRTEAFEPKETFKKIVGLLDLKDSNAGVSLYTSVIGEPSIARVNVATLPQADGGSVLDRRRNLSRFLQKGLVDFQELAQPVDDSRTEIFRTLVSITDQFQPGVDRTLLIIESDFVENGYVTSFGKYANNPSGLMDDFDKIIAAFKGDNGDSLPDLTGAEVILVVTQNSSELSVWSVKFFKKAMLETFGAKEVKIKATL